MSEVGFSATVTISINEAGDKRYSLVSSEPIVVSISERLSSEDGEHETVVELIPPDVSETHFVDGDDDEGDELLIEIVGANDEDDDLPLAAEGDRDALPH